MNAGATNWSRELQVLGGFAGVFVLLFFLPVGVPRFDNALKEGLEMTKWYAREHVLLCLVPALFIAGGISVFVSQASVMRYLGPKANKAVAYGVASVSGTILAVCSCTVLPLFGGIWMRGAGLGPATAFLYSGPAINILAIVMTARVLGLEMGTARAVGAVAFSILVGLAMYWIFRREEQGRAEAAMALPEPEVGRPLWQTTVFFAAMVGVLVFANWSRPDQTTGPLAAAFAWKWPLTAAFAAGLGVSLGLWFGFRWAGLALVAGLVVVLSVAFPKQPMIPFTAGCAGLAVLCARNRGEGSEWLEATWTLGKTGLPVADRRGVRVRPPPGEAPPGRCHSFGMGQPVGGWKFAPGEFFLVGGGGVHVFRYSDGGADFAGIDGVGYGKRPGAGAVAGWSGAVVAEHAGAPQHHGHEEDRGLCVAGGCDGDGDGIDLRSVVQVNNKSQ